VECSVYYDLVKEGFPYWYWPIIGVGFLALGWIGFQAFGLVCKSRFMLVQRVAGLIGTVVAFGISVYLALNAYLHYRILVDAIEHGAAQRIEGAVTSVIPAPPQGPQVERFTIDGKRFSYSGDELEPGFRQTRAHGSPIREGLKVRIEYVGNTIVRLETCK
jgi:hypothetical protein